jgi:hypothetical protein
MGKDVWTCRRAAEAKREDAARRRRRNEWVRKKPRGMKGPDRCLDEDEGRNSIARVGSETAGLSNPTGHTLSYG